MKSVYCSLQLMSEFWEKKKGGKSSEIHYDNVCNLPFLLYSFLYRCIHQVRIPIWRFEFAPKLSFQNWLNWAMIIEAIQVCCNESIYENLEQNIKNNLYSLPNYPILVMNWHSNQIFRLIFQLN